MKMQATTFEFRKFTARFLTGAYLAFWFAWALHPLVATEHHHHEKPVCTHAPGEKHLHSAEYAPDDCPVCHFLPAAAEAQTPDWPTLQASPVLCPKGSGEPQCFTGQRPTFAQPRAPPCCCAA